MSKKKAVRSGGSHSRPVRVDSGSYSRFVAYCDSRGLTISRHVAFALDRYVKEDAAQFSLLPELAKGAR